MKLTQILKTWRVNGSGLLAELTGGIAATAVQSKIVTPTYGAAITIDCSLGDTFIITATNGTAFAISAPTNPPISGYGSIITITIANTSGGALGAVTFNAAYKMGAAWTSPATANQRSIQFRYNGTDWNEVNRSAADVDN